MGLKGLGGGWGRSSNSDRTFNISWCFSNNGSSLPLLCQLSLWSISAGYLQWYCCKDGWCSVQEMKKETREGGIYLIFEPPKSYISNLNQSSSLLHKDRKLSCWFKSLVVSPRGSSLQTNSFRAENPLHCNFHWVSSWMGFNLKSLE